MAVLRHTETNAADDAAGRAFGLDGNLYAPVVAAMVVALAGFALLTLVLKASLTIASLLALTPLGLVFGWVLGLKQGKPAGYDRDLFDYLLDRGHFTRRAVGQGRLLS